MRFVCPHKFGQIVWMTEARLVFSSPWLTIHGVGYLLPPQAIVWSILENRSSQFNHRNLYVLLPTVPLALHNKPQSPCHRNRLHCKHFYKMSCSSLSLWVLKDDTCVEGLVKSHMIWKLRLHSKYSIWVILSTFMVVCVRFAAWNCKNQVFIISEIVFSSNI